MKAQGKTVSVRNTVAVKAKKVARTAQPKARKVRVAVKPREAKSFPPWNLRLYVAGQSPKSLAAFANLKKLCETHLPNQYLIEVVDLSRHPQLAQSDQIVALPTLVRKLPEPIKRVIGDLSNLERVLVGMEILDK